jgi:ABC-2 type transport system ATP-binding protein
VIELRDLSKRYGDRTAVDRLTLDVVPGRVTGFLGPNGAGKTTTMRLILGLNRPTAGIALVNGKPYAQHRHPLRQVGALLDATAIHPRRTARNHLRAMAATHHIGRRRVDELLDVVGLTEVADRPAGTFSLGMNQRLGIAGALLGDPAVVMLDEPVNGLDPDGVRWIRTLLRDLADQGRTVFVSSHLMSEMEQTADHLVIIGLGRLVADTDLGDLVAGRSVRVRGPRLTPLAEALADHSLRWESATELVVTGVSAEQIGDLALEVGVALHHLSPVATSLEQAYLELTADSLEYSADRRPR